MYESRPIAKLTRVCVLAVLGFGFWAYILYWCFRMAPLVTVWISLGLLLCGVIGIFLSQFRRRSSLKLVVLFIPVLIALICLPARTAVQSRNLLAKLSDAGISEFQVLPDASWRWAGAVIRNTLDTELVSVELDLTQLDQEKLERVPRGNIRFVTLQSEDSTIRIGQPVIDWIRGCPLDPTLSLHLCEPNYEELAKLADLQLLVSWQSTVLSESSLEYPSLTHLHLDYCEVRSEFGTLANLPKLSSFVLNNSTIADGEIFTRFSPKTHLQVFQSSIATNTSALFKATTQNINVTKYAFVEEIVLPSESLGLPGKNTLMFQNCQFSEQSLLAVMRYRRSSKLLMTDCSPLHPTTVSKLLEMPFLEKLILGGSWITAEHLSGLPTRETPLHVGLERVLIDPDQLITLQSRLPKHVKLGFTLAAGM